MEQRLNTLEILKPNYGGLLTLKGMVVQHGKSWLKSAMSLFIDETLIFMATSWISIKATLAK